MSTRQHGLSMTQVFPEGHKENDYIASSNQVWQVRSTMPGLGFWSDTTVDGNVASLIRIAIEVGKQQKAAEIRNVLGVG